ncbi:MAG: glutamate 5-kinase [Campylobacterales bacterium]
MKERIVVKVGSAVLAREGQLNVERMQNLVDLIVRLRERYEVMLVTSGAVATGQSIVPSISRATTAGKQALAAIGQAELINRYKKKFEVHGVHVAQILLTADDFDSFKRSENAKTAINTLLEHGIVPIINENDSVVVDEILRGDNDQLSAQVAHYFDAGLLVILSDIDGYYDRDPNKYPDAKMYKIVNHIPEEKLAEAYNPNHPHATGGIVTKLKAAYFLMRHGRRMLLASGFDLSAASAFLLEGRHEACTLFVPGNAT